MSSSPELAGTLSAEALAEKYGLSKSSVRPAFGDYVRDLWSRRQFVVSYARARIYAAYAGARLGSLWQVLTPLLNAAVYYMVFGLMMKAASNVENYTAFLISGIFVFTYTQRSVMEGTRSISANMSLIRTLHFPRATLPFAYVMNELMVFARLGAFVGDIAQIMPFALRTWLYVSGVFFSIPAALAGKPWWIAQLITLNPAAAYIDIVRQSLLAHHEAHSLPNAWPIAIGWALVALVGGFWYFWRAEDRYGRG